ncbi:hypothetical protein HA402_014069 [Bradysia odoriphaga]|nr:hypothetical protein HA402_014069 [Bradysia odoriphaga]
MLSNKSKNKEIVFMQLALYSINPSQNNLVLRQMLKLYDGNGNLLFGAAVACWYWIRSKATYFERLGFLSKRPTFPHGNLKGVDTEFHLSHALKQLYEEFKNKSAVHGLYRHLMSPIFVVTDLDVIKDILIKDFDNFRNRGIIKLEHDVLFNHLFSIQDEPWKTMRSNLSPSFTSGKMKIMFHTVVDISHQLVAYMKEQDVDVVEVKEVLGRFTTDVIGNVAFGLESNSLQEPNSMFRKMGLKFFSMDRIRLAIAIAAQNVPNADRCDRIFPIIIRDTVDYRRKNKIERKDFLDLLLKVDNGGRPLSLNEMTAQSFLFWIAGFESSSSTATFCLYLLSINQNIQDELRNEIRTTLSKYDNQINL